MLITNYMANVFQCTNFTVLLMDAFGAEHCTALNLCLLRLVVQAATSSGHGDARSAECDLPAVSIRRMDDSQETSPF